MQQHFARMTGLRVIVFAADGRTVGPPTAPAPDRTDVPTDPPIIEDEGARRTAPILLKGRQIGTIAIEDLSEGGAHSSLATAQGTTDAFLNLWVNCISHLCHQGYELGQRVEELSALYKLSTLLSAHRNLQELLDAAARNAAEVMNVKAASIRLLDEGGRELIPKAVFNLSPEYLNKGPIVIEQSELYRQTFSEQMVYVENMATDPRVLYPEDARREGLVSILSAAMVYRDRPIGVIRLYTGRLRRFSKFEINMLHAVAQLLATAIENARLMAEHMEKERIQHQLHMAAAVQRRMMPASCPTVPHFDIAARYVPSFELGGDFYDFISLDGHLGIAVGDVVGKGLPASLLMASVRASLRAYAQDVYDLDEIISRVNIALARETRDNEFATLFYAVIDPPTRRMTYCNAGHEPPLLLRRGRISRLEVGGMIVGIDENQQYEKGLVDLQAGDLMLFYTDGLSESQNFAGESFGRERVIQAMHDRADAPARDAMNHILWEMRRYVGLKTTVDDTTLVVVKVEE